MKFSEFSALRDRPTSLTCKQCCLVFFWFRIDVEQELDHDAERVETKELLALSDALKLGVICKTFHLIRSCVVDFEGAKRINFTLV